MPPVLRYQRFRRGQPRESVTLPPGAPLLSGEETLIAVRWGRYRVCVGARRRLRAGDVGRIEHGADRYDFEVLASDRGFRPVLVEEGDPLYLGSLSLSAAVGLAAGVVAWTAPPINRLSLMTIPDTCVFSIALPPVEAPPPCGTVLPEDVAGMSEEDARQRVDQIVTESATLCGMGAADGNGPRQVGIPTVGMIALEEGDPFAFAALNRALRECQRGLEGEVDLSIKDGVASTPGAEDLAGCLNEEALPVEDAELRLRLWQL